MGKKDCISGGIFAALGVVIWAFTFQFPTLPGGHPGPSLFPRVLATLFILFGSIVIRNGLLAGRSKTPAPPVTEDEGGNVIITGKANYFNAVFVIILIGAFIVASGYLGFIISGGAVLFLLMWKLRIKPIKSLIISAFVICFIYSVFAKILRVPLPHGFLWW
jgi:putative tricarboxylic transport membrane protein